MGRRSDGILRTIAVLKLLKAAALVAVAFGVLSHHWLRALHPSNHVLRHAISRITAMSLQKQTVIAIGTFVYAALFLVEGIGLFMKQLWAEYLTTIITISFIPIEIYELVEHCSAIKAGVLVLNIAIVGYLLWRLRSDRKWPFRQSNK